MPAKSLKLMGKPELVTAAKPKFTDHTFSAPNAVTVQDFLPAHGNIADNKEDDFSSNNKHLQRFRGQIYFQNSYNMEDNLSLPLLPFLSAILLHGPTGIQTHT